MCSFRFCPAVSLKIANFAEWCLYNEPISGTILLKFDLQSIPFRGLIGETNVRHIEVSVIRVNPFYNII